MKKIFGLVGILNTILFFLLSGCSLTDGMYRLTPGMNRQQVASTIGKPDGIETCGDFEIWYYKPYYIGSHYQYLQVTFDNGRVASFVNPGVQELKRRDLTGLPDYSAFPATQMIVQPPPLIRPETTSGVEVIISPSTICRTFNPHPPLKNKETVSAQKR